MSRVARWESTKRSFRVPLLLSEKATDWRVDARITRCVCSSAHLMASVPSKTLSWTLAHLVILGLSLFRKWLATSIPAPAPGKFNGVFQQRQTLLMVQCNTNNKFLRCTTKELRHADSRLYFLCVYPLLQVCWLEGSSYIFPC